MKRFLALMLGIAVIMGVFVPAAVAATYKPSADSTIPVTVYTSAKATKTKAYASTAGKKILKTYTTSGKKLTVYKVNKNWYKAKVTISGKKKTGYFKTSQLDFPKKGKNFKVKTRVPGTMKAYSSMAGTKVLKTYDRKATKTLKPFTQQWCKTTIKVKGKNKTAYVKVAEYKKATSKNTKWILIDQSKFKLYLYKGSKVSKKYPITVGMQGHSTPNGTFTIVAKRPNPTWVNPAPNGWGSNMPATIGPGPSNPLGVRALNLSVSGIRIHGSANPKNGTRSSHGCIRLTNKNIKDLYKKVSVGTVVKIQK